MPPAPGSRRCLAAARDPGEAIEAQPARHDRASHACRTAGGGAGRAPAFRSCQSADDTDALGRACKGVSALETGPRGTLRAVCATEIETPTLGVVDASGGGTGAST